MIRTMQDMYQAFKVNDVPEWVIVERVTSQKMFNKNKKRFDSKYGSQNWKLGFQWGKNYLTEEEIFKKIELSYKQFLKDSPSKLKLLEENVEEINGGTYTKKAFKQVLNSVNVTLSGDKKLDVSSKPKNEFEAQYNSGFVKFVDPDKINSFKQHAWWKEDSIEAFLRNNKVILVKGSKLIDSEPAVALVFRKDLGLGLGKLVAQAAHGIVTRIYQKNYRMSAEDRQLKQSWLASDRVLLLRTVKSFEDLNTLDKIFEDYSIPTTVIRDAGHTQIASGTRTCIAIGPIPVLYLEHLLNCFKTEILR